MRRAMVEAVNRLAAVEKVAAVTAEEGKVVAEVESIPAEEVTAEVVREEAVTAGEVVESRPVAVERVEEETAAVETVEEAVESKLGEEEEVVSELEEAVKAEAEISGHKPGKEAAMKAPAPEWEQKAYI